MRNKRLVERVADRAPDQRQGLGVVDAERVTTRVRGLSGQSPAAAARFRDDWLRDGDYVELGGVGALPAARFRSNRPPAELIVGVTAERWWPRVLTVSGVRSYRRC